MSEEKPTPQTGTMIAILAVAISAATFLANVVKDESAAVSGIERRLCRLEALNNMGECKR